MNNRVPITLEVTQDQYQQIESLAHQLGYEDTAFYLLDLVAQDKLALEEKALLLEDLHISIGEALRGDTIPASDLMKALDSEDD